MSAVYIGIAFAAGCVVTMLIFRAFIVGKLRVVSSDDPLDREQYMFLELDKPDISKVTNKTYVILKVDTSRDLSQK